MQLAQKVSWYVGIAFKKAKELESENSELKRMHADQAITIKDGKRCYFKKVVGPCAKKHAYYYLKVYYNASQRLICKTLHLCRSTLK